MRLQMKIGVLKIDVKTEETNHHVDQWGGSGLASKVRLLLRSESCREDRRAKRGEGRASRSIMQPANFMVFKYMSFA